LTARQVYTFETGHVWHKHWQLLAAEIGLSVCGVTVEDGEESWWGLAEIEVKDDDLQVMGHFDLLTAPIAREGGKLTPGKGKAHFIVDFKTMSDIPKASKKMVAYKAFKGRERRRAVGVLEARQTHHGRGRDLGGRRAEGRTRRLDEDHSDEGRTPTSGLRVRLPGERTWPARR